MSSYSMITALVAASSLFASVNGHMTMKTPAPYGASDLDTSPLLADGSNFPCKQRANVYGAASAKNSYAIGAEVPLTFSGSASHGGGSCQISLSTDKAPTKNSKWMVIHSIEGGCPVKGSSGNTGSDSYTFKVPDGVQPGDYTLAWTWFNRIGNREMYMNCAPFTVTGGSSKIKRNIEARKASPLQAKRDTSANFPAMFIANICGNKCNTVETSDVGFPNPGANVDNFAAGALVTPTCSCDPAGGAAAVTPVAGGSAAPSSAGTGAATTAAPAGPVSSATSAASAPTSAVASGPASAATSVVATGGSDSGILSTAVATVTAASTAAAAAPTGSSVGSASQSTTCSGGASMVCSADGTQFGLCNNGAAVMQSVASGTKCMGGNIVAA